MPGEFEPIHKACWLLFPTRHDHWRDNAIPAQYAYVHVAVNIAFYGRELVRIGVPSGYLETAEKIVTEVYEQSLVEYMKERQKNSAMRRNDMTNGEEKSIVNFNVNANKESEFSFDSNTKDDIQDWHKLITLVKIDFDQPWVRDIGPTFVTKLPLCLESSTSSVTKASTFENKTSAICWSFNNYGAGSQGKGSCSPLDLLVNDFISEYEGVQNPLCLDNFVLEGGSFHVDGEGTCIVTEETLLNSNRNPQLNKEDIEYLLRVNLNISKIIWLPKGIIGDEDTNGHVDNFVCFARPGEIILHWVDHPLEIAAETIDDKESCIDTTGTMDHIKHEANGKKVLEEIEKDINDRKEQYLRSSMALKILEDSTDAKGRKFVIHKLKGPVPLLSYNREEVNTIQPSEHWMNREAGERLAATYVNFYIANEAIILPQFGNIIYDNMAIERMKEIFPERCIIPVASREILLGGGNIHCITQQILI